MFRFTFAIAMAIFLTGGSSKAHDYTRPDLDDWYRSLHRKGLSFSCCSKQDCHTTEAELRDGVWWARLGTPVILPDGRRDWILGDYVRIPDELIVRGENGLPVPNPEGEAVVCQQLLDSLIPPDEDEQS
jgi:hypothetical protein